MNKHTAIKIENLSKQYRLGLVGTGTLSHDLKRWWTMNVMGKEDPYLKVGEVNVRESKGQSDYVWALKDINLEIEQGDVVGIIGKNGAGKSTLLKILSRVTKPTTGNIQYRGRIASLLEVGTGFHLEMTGRENIYMNGAIMGMTRHEITRKLDEIVAFAGVERYIDTPVKRYSSGMTVRLGFAVAAHLEPDILVVDEVLAVGDAEFQKKAIGKMQDVSRKGGRTVLFVSHNMAAVKSLCGKGIIMNDGYSSQISDVTSTVYKYLEENFDKLVQHVFINSDEQVKTDFDAYIESAKLISNHPAGIFMSGNELEIEIDYFSRVKAYGDMHLGVYDAYGTKLTHTSFSFVKGTMLNFDGNGTLSCKIPKVPLMPGKYHINLSLHLGGKPYHRVQNALSFMLEQGDFFKNGKLPAAADSKFLIDTIWDNHYK